MENFNALLSLSEIKTLYSGKPVGICPLYKGVIGTTKTFEATGNPITIPEYKSLVKLTTQFSPKQAGTGDPSPDNVRPISGWDSVKVTVSNGSESHDYDIALPETIYGGTADAVTGVGEKLWEFVEFDGTEEWSVTSNESGKYFYLAGTNPPLAESNTGLCSSFLVGGVSFTTADLTIQLPYTPALLWRVKYNMASTVEEFKAFLTTQAAADTPVQVAYKLATPEPFEVSQVSIPSLGGENTFFTNGENMDIIYNETSFWG